MFAGKASQSYETVSLGPRLDLLWRGDAVSDPVRRAVEAVDKGADIGRVLTLLVPRLLVEFGGLSVRKK
jgi:hypothetical protein